MQAEALRIREEQRLKEEADRKAMLDQLQLLTTSDVTLRATVKALEVDKVLASLTQCPNTNIRRVLKLLSLP